ncbi:hypothetical protein HanXRQr2_Chr14g0630901 [Helianthus annuus]|uniref:Uncharacterized protein n=1 Tax=Helianthus annuus TaxID=4232 RepID=A0A9K3E8L2_HELAN|nr:hypothetical protein HanXRQr2_Chr14g0630901 [Helianthus annuus]KAJ0839298.1 hypothetical protein HanPSC8_Chr14g0605131 [Helianthus annuus]
MFDLDDQTRGVRRKVRRNIHHTSIKRRNLWRRNRKHKRRSSGDSRTSGDLSQGTRLGNH